MSDKVNLKLNTAWSTLSSVIKAVVLFLQMIIIANYIPKSELGIFALAMFLINFSDIFLDIGLSSAVLHKQTISPTGLSSLFWLNVVFGIVVYIIIIAITRPIAFFYQTPMLEKVIPLLSFFFIPYSFSRLHKTLLQRDFFFREQAIIDIFTYVSGLALLIMLLKSGFGLYSLIYSVLATNISSSIMVFLFAIRKYPILFKFSLSELKTFLAIGIYQLGSRIFDFLAQQADILILGKTLGMESLGIYSLMKQLVYRIGALLNTGLGSVMVSHFSKKQYEEKKLLEEYLLASGFYAIINFPIFFLIASFPKPVILLTYGAKYAEATFILSIISVTYSIFTLGNTAGSLQIAKGRTDIGFYWTIFRVTAIFTTVYLASLISIEVVVISQLFLAVILYGLYFKLAIKKMLKLSLSMYASAIRSPIIASLISFFGLMIILHLLFANPGIVLELLFAMTSMILYLGILYIMKPEALRFLSNRA